MRDNGYLGNDVDLAELAKRSKNFSGAEIEGPQQFPISNSPFVLDSLCILMVSNWQNCNLRCAQVL